MSRLEIKQAVTPEDHERIYRMRYEVYVEEMRRTQKHADHAQKIIREPLDEHGILFFAEFNGEVVGTLRSNYYRRGELGYYPELYKFHLFETDLWQSFSVTTKLIVRPEFRAGTLGTRLAINTFERLLLDGIAFDFIDCNPHLERYFEKLGYLRYSENVQHPEFGRVMPLVLPFHDLDHLKRVASPLARVLERRQQLFIQTTQKLQGACACQL